MSIAIDRIETFLVPPRWLPHWVSRANGLAGAIQEGLPR